jgi:hypothetical protein
MITQEFANGVSAGGIAMALCIAFVLWMSFQREKRSKRP